MGRWTSVPVHEEVLTITHTIAGFLLRALTTVLPHEGVYPCHMHRPTIASIRIRQMQLVLLDMLSREFRAGTTWLTTTPPSKRRHGFRPWHYHTVKEEPHSVYRRGTAHEGCHGH